MWFWDSVLPQLVKRPANPLIHRTSTESEAVRLVHPRWRCRLDEVPRTILRLTVLSCTRPHPSWTLPRPWPDEGTTFNPFADVAAIATSDIDSKRPLVDFFIEAMLWDL